MNVLIKSAVIIDTDSKYHNKKLDILIEDGRIVKISKSIKKPDNFLILKLDNLHVSRGWFDSSVSFGEPGFEERETIENGLRVASTSGFTDVVLNANTFPVADNHSALAFIKSKSKNSPTTIHPNGALTQSSKGEDLAELFDMTEAGGVSFGDYKSPITNPNLLKIALQYASSFDALIQSFPYEPKIAQKGVVNEHETSTYLGLKGMPNLSEDLQVARDLFILEYTGGKLHIPTISTAKSVELIRAAKAKKLNVTCSVALHNLYFSDQVLKDFNTNFKVLPPLRTPNDIEALIGGLNDGTIDMITSDHNPIDIEHKKVEFDFADFGSIGLETFFGILNQLFSTKKAIKWLTAGKSRFGVNDFSIQEGNSARMTLFNPSGQYLFNEEHILSKSKNAIFLGAKLKGKVYGVIANNRCSITS
jgi:dihydroorotase